MGAVPLVQHILDMAFKIINLKIWRDKTIPNAPADFFWICPGTI